MLVQETWLIREPDGSMAVIGESGTFEAFTDDEGELFRAMQHEHGRCTSRVYIGEGVPIGWVFEARRKYTDSDDTYLAETWVTLHEKPPVTTVEHHYKELTT